MTRPWVSVVTSFAAIILRGFLIVHGILDVVGYLFLGDPQQTGISGVVQLVCGVGLAWWLRHYRLPVMEDKVINIDIRVDAVFAIAVIGGLMLVLLALYNMVARG